MAQGKTRTIDADILVVGAGVLGVAISYWLSVIYDCKIILADREQYPGRHTTSRNTGVVHRPFYLDPVKKRTFALTSRLSYPLWRRLAESFGLPWRPVGTFNVALTEADVRTLEKYKAWGVQNGMLAEELDLLDGHAVSVLEPEVKCRAALHAKTDVSVDFGALTLALFHLAMGLGVRFMGGSRVESVREGPRGPEASIVRGGDRSEVRCRLLINAAGGGALGLAHACGLAEGYSELYFRGEYWVVDEPFASRIRTNVYRPPRYPQFPFLDPHLVVRADGSRQVGPNAAMVTGPYVYGGPGLRTGSSLLARPLEPKLGLLSDPSFLRLVAGEWMSSVSKGSMCGRVKKFIPALDRRMLTKRAVFGVRSSLVGAEGFVPEAVLIGGEKSVHILNYNSPGATGAPAYSAMVVSRVKSAGLLDGLTLHKSPPPGLPWDFRSVEEEL